MKQVIFFFILIGVLLYGCPTEHYFRTYYQTDFPDSAVNLGDINSVYDDYNSASPLIGNLIPLCFSTNRNSQGQNFDIIMKMLDVYYLRRDGILHVEEDLASADSPFLYKYSENVNIKDALWKINTESDELGPYMIPGPALWEGGMNASTLQTYIFLYATNKDGNFNIEFTQNLSGDSYSDPREITYLNSPADDLYPTLNHDSTAIYFCSNREGHFDIYHVAIDKSQGLVAAFSDSTEREVVKDPVLSSAYDDKCPFIFGDLLVFASNRPGGFGRFDLYYSIYIDGAWSAPVNFGDKINTSSDEYRPIVKFIDWGFNNDFMLFSSNRPGGKGGFDLYYVGIEKMSGIAYY